MGDVANMTGTDDAEASKFDVVARRVAAFGADRCAYVAVRSLDARAGRATPERCLCCTALPPVGVVNVIVTPAEGRTNELLEWLLRGIQRTIFVENGCRTRKRVDASHLACLLTRRRFPLGFSAARK